MYTVYVLYSPIFRKTYTGFTSDLEKRLASHNVLATKGYTIRYRPWDLLYTEEYATKAEALKREKELKQGNGRLFIQKLIKEKYHSI